MRAFRAALADRQSDPSDRQWFYVPYDQLTASSGPSSRADPQAVGIVLVESAHKAARRPYHRQKLLWVLASMRHFALEQAERGVAVDYRASQAPYVEVLREVVGERGPLTMQEPAEWELRQELEPLLREGQLQQVPHEGWCTRRPVGVRARRASEWSRRVAGAPARRTRPPTGDPRPGGCR
ncbi:MAG: cryptochrome/photolyase family protein [Myxococcales bacterium]|nr:cryptochrome/photolyase family protein [Myxococcales bacterium]